METKPAEVRDYQNLTNTLLMAQNIVTKDYLCRLKEMEVCRIPENLRRINIAEFSRIYRIKKVVTDKNENTIDKLVTVLNAAYSSRATVVTLIEGYDSKVEYYIGIVSKDVKQAEMDVSTQGEIFKSTLLGNFPGLQVDSLDQEAIESLCNYVYKNDNITAVSGLASIRNSKEMEMKKYVQGLEHLVDAMGDRTYSIVMIADPVSAENTGQAKAGYENLYTQLSPFLNTSLSLNEADSVNLTNSHTEGFSKSVGESVSMTQNYSETSNWETSTSHGRSHNNSMGTVLGIAVGAAATVLTGGAAAPLMIAGGTIGGALLGSDGENSQESSQYGGGKSRQSGYSQSRSSQQSVQNSDTNSMMTGKTQGRTMQFSNENRAVKDLLQKIDKNIERIENCESYGAFQCAAYIISSDPETNAVVANGYNALMKGEKSFLQSSYINQWTSSDNDTEEIKEYLKKFSHPNFIYGDENEVLVSPASLQSAYELAVSIGLPKKSVNGLPVMESAAFGRNVFRMGEEDQDRNKIYIGDIFHMGKQEEKNHVDLSEQSLSMHTFITGSTGSGKSNTVYQILSELGRKHVKFLVVEPAKGEYKNMFGQQPDVHVYGTNPMCTPLLRINPFKFPKGIHVLEHIDRLVEIFNVCWPMYAAMPAVLKSAVLQAYEVCGWDLIESVNTISPELFPTFQDLLAELTDVIDNSSYDSEVKSNYKGSLETRVMSLADGLNGQIFSADEIDNQELFDSNVIVDLSRIGSMETKSLIMGLMVMRLSEYRMTHSDGMNVPLKHVTVLEEAHNILKRTSTEQSMEGANVAGKSVEMISNAIAEMRTYGEGFIIADQSPSAVDVSAIRNTNTKIIMRLPDEIDRRAAGKSAGLRDDQLDEIAKLQKGVAVVYQNDWVEPVLCKIKKYPGEEKMYTYAVDQRHVKTGNDDWFKKKLLKLLMKGRVNEAIEVDIKELREEVPTAELSTKDKIGVYQLLDEYEKTEKLTIWEDVNFRALSSLVVGLFGCGSRVENLIAKAKNFEDLNQEFVDLIHRKFGEASDEMCLSLSQCFMKDYSVKEEKNLEIYSAWREIVMKRGEII